MPPLFDASILVLALFAVLAVVFGHAFSSESGYITPDSARYLRLAERMLDGHGMFVPASGRLGPDEVWFATWPAGYSVAIAGVSLLTGASTFVASKIANALLLWSALVLLYAFIGRGGLIAGMVLLTAGTLHNASMTWSETAFLVTLVYLSLVIANIMSGHTKVVGLLWILLPIIMVLPFFFRYIGAFTFGPILFAIVQLYRGNRRKDAMRLLLTTGMGLSLCVMYLFLNWLQTGFATGQDRITASESHTTLFAAFVTSILNEIALPLNSGVPGTPIRTNFLIVWAIGTLALGTILLRSVRAKTVSSETSFSLYFLLFGVTYLGAISFMRWNFHFDPFSLRLIDPGTTLVFIAGALWLWKAYKNSGYVIGGYFLGSALLSICLHGIEISQRSDFTAYATSKLQAVERYEQLPENAIVVFGQNTLFYLKPDIQVAFPRFRPTQTDGETWQSFIEKLQPGLPVYADIGGRGLRPNRFHPTVYAEFADMSPDSLVLIRP